jgi:hypothetical protein
MKLRIAANLAPAMLALVGSASMIAAAHAETIVLKADLKGSNEVPPNNSPAAGKA